MTTCPKCNTFRIKKYGKRKNKRGIFQRFRCKSCRTCFIDDDFLHMQTPKKAVSFAIRMRTKTTLSCKQIMEEVEKLFGIKRCATAIYYWLKKFLHLFDVVNELSLQGISKRLHMDYTYLTINGEDAYFWGVKCPATGIIVGWCLSLTRKGEYARKVLRGARHHFTPTYELEELVTDGEQSFPRAIWEVFDHSVKHYRYKGFRDKKNNNTIEELWRFKNYIPQFRSFEQAEQFFRIWVAMYNLRKSEQLRKSQEACELMKMIKICQFFREVWQPTFEDNHPNPFNKLYM